MGPDGGSGSRMIGSPVRPMSPEKTIRWLPPSLIRRSIEAEPRMCPASTKSSARCLRRWVIRRYGTPIMQLLDGDRVGQVVEGLALRPGLSPPLQVLVVLLLDVRRVRQHDRREVAGGGGGVDRAVEAVADEQREPARVVDVRVAQHHAVEAPRVERELGVELVRLRPAALEQAGVEQEARACRLEQVHRAGHLSGGAPEGQTNTGHGSVRDGR